MSEKEKMAREKRFFAEDRKDKQKRLHPELVGWGHCLSQGAQLERTKWLVDNL